MPRLLHVIRYKPGLSAVQAVLYSLEYDLIARRALLPAALELLVDNRVTGLPVLDDDGTVVGVVSDYDLLSLEGIAESAAVLSLCLSCKQCSSALLLYLTAQSLSALKQQTSDLIGTPVTKCSCAHMFLFVSCCLTC